MFHKRAFALSSLYAPNTYIIMGRFEFTTYGSKVTVNEGDLHAEYRYLLHPAFEVYPYVEAQWAGTHGLLRKVSTGLQARYRTLYTPHSTMFLTTALYYEAEDWKNLSGDTAPVVPMRKMLTFTNAYLDISF